MRLPFIKLSASGNDFILIDNRNKGLDIDRFLPMIPSICKRGLSVGADGVILLAESDDADIDWTYFNSDGSSAKFCINGILSSAIACSFLGLKDSSVTFATPCGIIKTEIKNKRVRICLPAPVNIHLNQELSIDGKPINVHCINTGVPHTVIFTDRLNDIPILEIGERIRNNARFLPDGTNVDFVKVETKSEIRIRTYERGVEGETLSCGTGAYASATVATLLGLLSSPVKVNTRGGYFTIDTIKNSLEGTARVIYTGELQDPLSQSMH